jgi:hypothetical protein
MRSRETDTSQEAADPLSRRVLVLPPTGGPNEAPLNSGSVGVRFAEEAAVEKRARGVPKVLGAGAAAIHRVLRELRRGLPVLGGPSIPSDPRAPLQRKRGSR